MVVVGNPGNPESYQEKKGAAADRDVTYKAALMDSKGNVDSHDIDRSAKVTLHEKLDPNSKTKASIADPPNSQKGGYADYQFVVGGGSYRVLRDWKVNDQPVRVLDYEGHQAYKYEVTTFDTNAKPPIKTEYTNTAPF